MARAKMSIFLFTSERYKQCIYVNVDGFILTDKLVSLFETDELCDDKLHGLKEEGMYETLEIKNMRIKGELTKI